MQRWATRRWALGDALHGFGEQSRQSECIIQHTHTHLTFLGSRYLEDLKILDGSILEAKHMSDVFHGSQSPNLATGIVQKALSRKVAWLLLLTLLSNRLHMVETMYKHRSIVSKSQVFCGL